MAIALMIPAVRGEACSCPPEPSPSEGRRSATAVIEARVVDQRAVFIIYDGIGIYPAIDYEVTVTRVWKGTHGRTVHVLRRGPCDPAFRIGTAYLIYAAADHGHRLVVWACTPTKPADDAARDVAELGVPIAVFDQTATPVPVSMPVRRRLRAYVLVGLAGYAWMLSERRDAFVSVEGAWLAAVVLQVCLGVICARRRRSRLGALLLGGAVPTALFAIIWSGQRALQNEWFSPFLMWST